MSDTPFKVLVNTHQEIDVLRADADGLDIIPDGNGFNIIHNNQCFHAEIISSNAREKTYVIAINGNRYSLNIGDRYDQLVNHLGLSAVATQKINEIKAPMPGLVLEVSVKEGDTIQKGDKVAILEAMKMENVIKAPGDGIIKKIYVQKGNPVEKGQLMIEL